MKLFFILFLRYYYSMDVFVYYDILDINGNWVVEGLKVSFCLEDLVCDCGVCFKYSC